MRYSDFLSRTMLVVGGSLLAAAQLACGGQEVTGPSAPGPNPAPLVLAIDPATIDLSPGESRQVRVQTRAPGGLLRPVVVTWTSANPSIAKVSPTGLVTAFGVGETGIIAASIDGRSTARAAVIVR